MSFFDKVKNVLSSPSVVEKAADGAIKGLDAIWHTAEEKEGDRQKRTELALKFVELTKGASPARRMIATVVISLWAFAGLNILILMNITFLVEDRTMMDGGIKSIVDFSVDYIAKPTGLVLAFYFLKNILPSK